MRTAIALILILAAAPAAAQLYRWTDSAGRVHYTDSPPPASAREVEKTRGASGPAAAPAEPYVLQQARKSSPVTLYSTSGCEACDLARSLLNARGVPFKEVSVAGEAQLAQLKKAVGSNSVPSLIVGADVFKGFEAGAYHRMLDVAGYPKPGILPPRAQAEPPAPPAPAADAPAKPEATEPEPARGPYSPRPGK